MKRALAVILSTLAVAACSSPPVSRAVLKADHARAGGAVGLASAAPAVHTATARPGPAFRLGYTAATSEAIAIVELHNGYLAAALGSMQLAPVRFPTGAAESAAMTAGHLDAAYIDPVDAIRAWQSTRGGVKIISGAAYSGGDSTTVLVVTTELLARHSVEVRELLKAQVQAENLLATNLTAGIADTHAELASFGLRPSTRRLAAEFALLRFTDDPLESSIAAEARRATAAGLIKPVGSLTGVYELGPLNLLLRSVGQRPVGS